jgi:hypothetical protein
LDHSNKEAIIMAEQEKVEKRKVTVKNTHARGSRFLFDATGKQVLVGPGEQAEVEVTEPEAKRLEEASKGGSDLRVEGHDPEAKQERLEEAPEQPKEHENRTALAEAERELMEAGQEGDKDRREKIAKMAPGKLAAETGIHMHARGLKPQVVASPPDAPPKKK